jgi:hypothetical protein
MRKSKIQPSTPLKLSINLIIPLLLGRQRIPNPRLLLIPQNIINLRKQKQCNAQQVDDDQVAVTAVVERLIIVAVDEIGADVTQLDGHVV